MVRYEKGTDVYTYTYNGDGQRLSKTVNGVTTEFTWDGMDMILESSGSTTSIYVYGNGINYRKTGSTVYTYTTNAHGDVVNYAQGTTVVKEYCYDAFGNELDEYDWRESENPLRYCGEYYDAETGLYYLRNRYYDPQTGRFITEDTHWNTHNMIYGDNSSSVPDMSAIMQSTNLYAYCINNPVKYTDPTGRVLPGDKEEFGEDSITYRSLVQLGKMWEAKPQYRADIEALANKVREITRNFGARAIIDVASRMAPNSANDTDIVIAVGTNFVYSNNAQQVATQYAKNNFPQTSPDGNQNNAFKHTMWNALNVKRYWACASKTDW